jgi:glucose-1-phosphate thymidylyltransferase
MHLLNHGRGVATESRDGVTVVDPVRIAAGVELEACTIGPNVTIGEGTIVRRSMVRDAIIGRHARIEDSTLEQVLIGDETAVVGRTGSRLVAAGDEIGDAP